MVVRRRVIVGTLVLLSGLCLVVSVFVARTRSHRTKSDGASYLSSRYQYFRDFVLRRDDPEFRAMFLGARARIKDGTANATDYWNMVTFLGLYGTRQERFDLAEKAIRKFPRDVQSFRILANLHLECNDTTAAREAMERCPDKDQFYYVALGRFFERIGERREACLAYSAGLDCVKKDTVELRKASAFLSSRQAADGPSRAGSCQSHPLHRPSLRTGEGPG